MPSAAQGEGLGAGRDGYQDQTGQSNVCTYVYVGGMAVLIFTRVGVVDVVAATPPL